MLVNAAVIPGSLNVNLQRWHNCAQVVDVTYDCEIAYEDAPAMRSNVTVPATETDVRTAEFVAVAVIPMLEAAVLIALAISLAESC